MELLFEPDVSTLKRLLQSLFFSFGAGRGSAFFAAFGLILYVFYCAFGLVFGGFRIGFDLLFRGLNAAFRVDFALFFRGFRFDFYPSFADFLCLLRAFFARFFW